MLLRVIIAAFLGALLAVPYSYSRRTDDGIFVGNLLFFIGVPLIVAALSKEIDRSAWRVAAGLLLFCPIVYTVTDRLDAKFEIARDAYLLGTGSVVLFISAAWIISSYKSSKWIQVVAAGLGVALSAFTNLILLWMVSYFE